MATSVKKGSGPIAVTADMFDGIDEAQVSSGRPHEKSGRYWMLITRLFGAKNHKKIFYIQCEKTVLKTIEMGHNPADDKPEGHQPGDNVRHYMLSQWDSFLSNVKQMVSGIADCDPSDVTTQIVPQFCETPPTKDNPEGTPSPFAGFVVEMNNTTKLRDNGKTWTNNTYVRQVPWAEVAEGLDEKILNRYFPDGLDELIAEEAE